MQFQLISSTYKNTYNGPAITLYGRDAEGNAIEHVTVV